VAAIVAVVALTAGCFGGGGAAPLPFGNADPRAQELYYLVNNDRAANGLGPVGWNDQLGGLAQSWSEHMAATGSFSHQNLWAIMNSPGYSNFSGLGENIISGGCGMSAAEMEQQWMASPGHRANILGNYSSVGIGVACDGGSVYATQDFGR
jgi:uncharacterized protein YkwD